MGTMVGMKDIAAITTCVKKHMRSHMYDIEPAWPFPVPVGLPDQAFLENNAIAVHDNNNEIRQWASKNGCEIITKHRTIGTSVELISKVVVPDESIAMRVVGRTLAAECREARRRIACLVAACDVAPETIESAARMTGHEQPDDFDLLVSAVRYFRHHDVTGMTPRQIPLTGFSGKWLNESKTNRRKAICRLLGVETLGLSKRPTELRFRYLDPVRDDAELERIIWCPWEGEALSGIKYAVIVENKDTYQTMPPIAQGICIWGSGRAVSDAVPAVPALRDMRIVYWGDMDADGLEILSTLRESGIECDSILMDCDAYDRYHRFGTDRTERSAKIAMSLSRRPAFNRRSDVFMNDCVLTKPSLIGASNRNAFPCVMQLTNYASLASPWSPLKIRICRFRLSDWGCCQELERLSFFSSHIMPSD